MVKKLDLFESNHGCGLNAPSQAKHHETDVTQRYTVQNWCVTYSKGRSERVGPSPMVSARSSILTLRGIKLDFEGAIGNLDAPTTWVALSITA
jgi:hypothetical protein